jgi:hypothetical protein
MPRLRVTLAEGLHGETAFPAELEGNPGVCVGECVWVGDGDQVVGYEWVVQRCLDSWRVGFAEGREVDGEV